MKFDRRAMLLIFLCIAFCKTYGQTAVKRPVGQVTFITIGSAKIALPLPKGFVLVTPSMSKIYEHQAHFISPKLVQYAFFIPDTQATAAINNELFATPKSIRVQMVRELEENKFPINDLFIYMKKYTRENNTKLMESVKSSIPNLVQKTNEDLIECLKYNPEFKFTQMIPVGNYIESKDYFGYSMITRLSSQDSTGATFNDVLCMTSIMILVKDKMINLYIYGGEKDLEWTRKLSEEWSKAIIDRNRVYVSTHK